jgi:two-component system response regulator AtoC
VVPLVLPPLRERREEILPLAEAFLLRERERRATTATSFDADTAQALLGYRWPGNVRELRAAVERAALYAEGRDRSPCRPCLPTCWRSPPPSGRAGRGLPSLREVEQAYIRHVLQQAGGSQTKAAAALGISRKALWEKRRRYGIP